MDNLIPKHKNDFSAINALKKLDDAQFKEIGMPILEWLQDVNWPISKEILDLVVKHQSVMTDPILTVLDGSDEWWKYSIITLVLPKLEKETIQALLPKLYAMSEEPTTDEKEIEVFQEVRDFLYDQGYLKMEKEVSELIFKLWNERRLPYIDGLLLQDGKYFANIRRLEKLENTHLLYSYLPNIEKYQDFFGEIDIFKTVNEGKYTVYCGDASHGSFGYILVLDENKEFNWLLFDDINPIVDIRVEDGNIYGINNCDEVFILPLKNPANYKIVSPN